MKALFLGSILTLGFLILVFMQIVILGKEWLVHKYIDKRPKPLSAFDYLQDFDGNWLITSLDYNALIIDNIADKEVISKKQKMITVCTRVYIILIFILIATCVAAAVLGIM